MFNTKKRKKEDLIDEICLWTGDALEQLKQLPSESVKLVITSPPYNIGKSYENKAPLEEYLSYQGKVIEQLKRILKLEGIVCWQVGNYVQGSGIIPLDIATHKMFEEAGFCFFKRFIWHFGFGMHLSNRFSGRYEVIMCYSKTKGVHVNHGKCLTTSEANAILIDNEFDKELINTPNVKGSHPEKTIHPCQYPIELAERCVLLFSQHGDVILDPYCGAGSTLIASIKCERKGWGIDKEVPYIKLTRKRISEFRSGMLKYRLLGTEILIPSGKLAAIPKAWQEKFTHCNKGNDISPS